MDLGWVDIDFGTFHYLLHFAWAAGRLAEWAVELGRMMELRNQSQPNPGPRPPAPPCTGGWVDLNFECSTVCWGRVAIQLGKMVEYPSQRQPNPGPQVDGALCNGC